MAHSAGVEVRNVRADWLRRKAGTSVRGAALELHTGSGEEKRSQVVLGDWLDKNKPGRNGPILALDHITDPQNVGAILRSAHLFGVPLVIIPARRSVHSGEGIQRSSAGAAVDVTTAIVSNLASALRDCRRHGWWIYVADTGGTPLPEVAFDDAAVIVLGAEGKGVSPGISRLADVTVTIPDRRPENSTVDSFNVSVATGIVLYEWYRGRAPA